MTEHIHMFHLQSHWTKILKQPPLNHQRQLCTQSPKLLLGVSREIPKEAHQWFVINTQMDRKEQRLATESHMNKGCALCFPFIPQARWPDPTSSKPRGVAQPSWAAPCASHPHRQTHVSIQLLATIKKLISINPQHHFSLLLFLAVAMKATKVTQHSISSTTWDGECESWGSQTTTQLPLRAPGTVQMLP